jgi:tetratricopeptide (TPR) repeat protein
LLAFSLCAACAFGQSASVSSSGTSSSSSAANSGSAGTIPDASVASPSPTPATANSSSGPTLRSDPYAPFDTGNSAENLKRLMDEDGGITLNITSIDSINQEDCGTWTAAGVHSSTVSMTRLEVPGKARGEYQRACSEMKKKKLQDAHKDAEKAIADHHSYPAAWVLLGQVYFNTSDMNDARQACSKAAEVDPEYVASYLCLAAIADREQNWDEAQKLSDHALGISPLKNSFALYYKADAAFHTEHLRDAEKDALDAAGADTNHQLPEIELLLARIYSAMRKPDEAVLRIRKYLKFAHRPDGPAAVDAQLAAITSPSAGQAK